MLGEAQEHWKKLRGATHTIKLFQGIVFKGREELTTQETQLVVCSQVLIYNISEYLEVI
jgi:hypothetical protein